MTDNNQIRPDQKICNHLFDIKHEGRDEITHELMAILRECSYCGLTFVAWDRDNKFLVRT